MNRKYRVTGVEGDDGIWVSDGVVLKLLDFSNGIFSGGILLCGNGVKRGEHRAFGGAVVVEENSE